MAKRVCEGVKILVIVFNMNNILVEKAADVVASPLANSTLSAMQQLVPLTSVT